MSIVEDVIKFKSCPFCGSKKGFTLDLEKGRGFQVGCAMCDSLGPRKLTREECYEAWNRRAQSKDIAKEEV